MKPGRYIVAMLLTLLPPRFREGLHLRGAALTCSILQIIVPVILIIIRLFLRAAEERAPLPEAEVSFLTFGGKYFGIAAVAGLAEFWLHPLHIILYYLLFEGVLRLLAALEGERILGSLPLYAIVALYDLRRRAVHKRELGALVVDKVVRPGHREGFDLKVYSCRPKLNWNPYITVEFEGQFYQMVKEEPGESPRRFVYFLKENPVGRAVVVIEHYQVDDVLKPPRDKDSWQQLKDKLSASMDPVVEDQILRGTARSGYDLKIYSSHPKLEWDSQVTIEFESHLYEVFKEKSAPKPRRFVYYLRRNPDGRLPRNILPYKVSR